MSPAFGPGPHPGSSSPAASERMRRAPSSGTGPEMSLWRELHRRGLRYRVQVPVPGNRARAHDTDHILVHDGWQVLRLWEHQGAAECADAVERAV